MFLSYINIYAIYISIFNDRNKIIIMVNKTFKYLTYMINIFNQHVSKQLRKLLNTYYL